ncbi:hypothetical protein AAC387_Pa05g0012 [Persea americana]
MSWRNPCDGEKREKEKCTKHQINSTYRQKLFGSNGTYNSPKSWIIVCVFSNIVLVLPRGSSLKPVEQSVANLSPINLSVRPTRWRKANISTNANSFKVRSGYRNSEGKELNINDSNEAMENKDDQSTKTKPHEETGQGTSKNDIQNEAGKEKRSIKENIDEIEAALAQLKKELGL